jgi:phosphoribosyl 1,2-cyclic phosphodiesterase
MSISFTVLGSGSKGNSTLLVLRDGKQERYALIDCGLSPRRTNRLLAPYGLALERISDILLTHLDGDHFHVGWVRKLRELPIRVHVHRQHRNRAVRTGIEGRGLTLFDGAFDLDGRTVVSPVLFAHDSLGTVGYVIEHAGHRFGHATDLGRVPHGLLEHFVDLHALAMESNYDRAMQLASPRPAMLKRRIMGGSGHLSNEESLEAVLAIAGRSTLSQIVLLHISEQCNHPRLLTRLYHERAPHLLDRLTISRQREATAMLEVRTDVPPSPLHLPPAPPREPRPGEQLAMF